MTGLRLFAVFFLVAVNGFFAAAEFSLVAVRQSRVRQFAKRGDSRARVVELLLADLGRVVSGVQVGITLASLALGYIGEITLAEFLRPLAAALPGAWVGLAAHTVALVLAFGLLTVVQVILGELVPKSLSLAHAERVALIIARPFHAFLKLFSWAINLLDAVADKIVNSLGVSSLPSHTGIRSAEELQIVIEQARDRGFLQPAEVQFMQNAMKLPQVQVRELMVPRPDMHVLPADATVEETMNLFATTQRSRIPVYSGSLDHIVGMVHVKDFIWVLLDRARRAEEHLPPPPFELRRLMRDVLIVPETKPASELLLEFRAQRTGLAAIVDEFGSILGMVTMEDILEQMIGEIHDEFDVIERPLVLADGSMIFDASLTVRDLETIYHISIPDDSQYETIGGFVLSRLGFMPRGGETFEENGYRFTVMEMDRRRISRIRVKSLAAAGKFAAVNLPEPNDANESNEANEPEQGSESAAARSSSDFPQPGKKPQTAPDVPARRAK
jgi:CBS domain containing-hemolysin-like protein